MFEYLMPLLVMPSLPRARCSTRRAIARSSRGRSPTARSSGCPGAMCESGYHKTDDRHLNYQYRAFGVPGLGFKRGLADDLVIAPYASGLALMVAPEAACANLAALARARGARRVRLLRGDRLHAGAPAPGNVAHRGALVHGAPPGHDLLALANALLDRPMQRRFPGRPGVPRHASCSCRSASHGPSTMYPHPAEVRRGRPERPTDGNTACVLRKTPSTRAPQVAPALERAVPRHGHQRRRRLQPLGATSPSPAGTRTRRATAGARSATCATSAAARFWSSRTSPRGRLARATRRSSRRAALSSIAADGEIETRTSRSPSRPRTTSRCGA